MKIVSFCFDDGFRATAGKVWRAFGARGLSACYAVLAAPERVKDPLIRASETADWGFWREAADAGHAVEPHGWAHEHLGKTPFAQATASIDRTIAVFQRELPGFERADTVFHLPYLAAPEPIVDWIGARMLAVRVRDDVSGLNDMPGVVGARRVNCTTFGPDLIDTLVESRIDRFIDSETGWLVLVLHGLDGEGWGPLSLAALERTVDRLLDAGVAIAPPSAVLRAAPRRAAPGCHATIVP